MLEEPALIVSTQSIGSFFLALSFNGVGGELLRNKFFIGKQLSALDVYWATFAALVQPLPPELCPMATAFRSFYTEKNPVVTAALSPLLLEHRDAIYREYLELPVVF